MTNPNLKRSLEEANSLRNRLATQVEREIVETEFRRIDELSAEAVRTELIAEIGSVRQLDEMLAPVLASISQAGPATTTLQPQSISKWVEIGNRTARFILSTISSDLLEPVFALDGAIDQTQALNRVYSRKLKVSELLDHDLVSHALPWIGTELHLAWGVVESDTEYEVDVMASVETQHSLVGNGNCLLIRFFSGEELKGEIDLSNLASSSSCSASGIASQDALEFEVLVVRRLNDAAPDNETN